ncbi:alpha/beta hydrolase [Sodalis ligni]|nr:alpha/beta hydrolase [Sodalis ligni]
MDTQLALLIARLARPAMFPMRTAESQQLAAMTTETLCCGEHRTRVLINENRDPQAKNALLLHGWGGHPMMLSLTKNLLHARGYRVYMPFLLGHDPLAPACCDFTCQCQLLLMMQKTFGTFDAVIAHSAGGIITALSYWLGFRFNQLVLLSAPASFYSLLRHYLMQNHVAEHYLTSLCAYYQSRYPVPTALQTESLYTFNAARVLIVHAKQDRKIHFADAQQIQAQLPNSQLEVIEDTGHMGILSHQRTQQVLAAFLCATNADQDKGKNYARTY